jgi:hypothetical protein
MANVEHWAFFNISLHDVHEIEIRGMYNDCVSEIGESFLWFRMIENYSE